MAGHGAIISLEVSQSINIAPTAFRNDAGYSLAVLHRH